MEDLTLKHAERVGLSNRTHAEALQAIRDAADAALRKEIAASGLRMVELAKAQDQERERLIGAFTSIIEMAVTEAAEAFAQNVGEIGASSAAMEIEMRERTAFVVNGTLPVRDPLPKAPPSSTEIAFRDDDQTSAEIHVLDDAREKAASAEQAARDDADLRVMQEA